MQVLVTGASGYVGGRLAPELAARGHRVRCLVRNPRKLDPAPWRGQVEVVRADLSGDLSEAMAGMDVAVEEIPSSAYPLPARRPLNSRLDCTGLAMLYGIPRPDWREGLRAVLDELGAAATSA